MEKCIFLDRFLQHPKDFRKIASFLKNKSTHDCIAFYYNSKQNVPYKRALKEHQLRKKRRGISWEATIQAAISVGSVVTAGTSIEKPLHFSLPSNDNTFHTRHFHPMRREIFDSLVDCDAEQSAFNSSEGRKKMSSKFKPSLGTLFSLDVSQRKFLRTTSQGSGSESENPNLIAKNIDGSNLGDCKKSILVARKVPPKWTREEKDIFSKIVDKYGK